PGDVEVQKVEVSIHRDHEIRSSGCGRLQQALGLLLLDVVVHGFAVIDHDTTELLYPATGFERAPRQSHPQNLLAAAHDRQFHAEGLASPYAAAEQCAHAVLAYLAVKQGLFRGELGAWS